MTRNSTERSRELSASRKEAGWVRLNDWLEPEAAKELEKRCRRQGKKRAQVIAELLAKA